MNSIAWLEAREDNDFSEWIGEIQQSTVFLNKISLKETLPLASQQIYLFTSLLFNLLKTKKDRIFVRTRFVKIGFQK